MSAQEDRGHLSEHLESLKAEFDNLDFNVLDDRKIIEQLLDKLVDAEIRITQFKEKRGLGDWNSWGPSLWNNIERNRITLERKLARIQLVELRDMEEKNQKRSFWSVFWAAVAALAALASAYLSYKSLKP